jgi:hypothetical protein
MGTAGVECAVFPVDAERVLPETPPWKKRVAPVALVLMLSLTAACGEEGPTGGVDTDITILTTDLDSRRIGDGGQCRELLTTVVDVAYLREHGVDVAEEDVAIIAIHHAVADACADGPPERPVHETAHEVVRDVEERLTGG